MEHVSARKEYRGPEGGGGGRKKKEGDGRVACTVSKVEKERRGQSGR